MPGKLLVAYATRYGSTAGVAEAIGQRLHDDTEENRRMVASYLDPVRKVV